ncbi:tryptophan-rich sensory protein [Fundicoccus sp. Sow4_D5]|uniref:tryptophan-rich sensory protein n=1 Tax=Fundicoccus sp. Sow4_D5 TaxID=3438782 RepID=UPI003F8F84B1
MKMETKTKAWINLGLLLLTIFVNFLGGTGQINGTSQAEVSDTYHTLITPAGFTFSIWSVIYSLLIISMITMVVKHKDHYYSKVIERITPFLWLSYLSNMIWIVLFSYQLIGLSTLFIFAYLFSLSIMMMRLKQINQKREWLIPLTIGLNTGWLFIASVVNLAAFLVQINWGGWGLTDSNWATILMVVAALFTFLVLFIVKNASFPLPIAWAFFGIFMELNTSGSDAFLGIVAIVCLIFSLLISFFTFYQNQKSIYPVKYD